MVDVVHTFSKDIGMVFGLDKCAVIEMKRGRVDSNDGIILPNDEEMRVLDEEGYKYLGILQLDNVLNEKIKEKVKSEYIKRVKKLCRSMLNA